MAEVGSISEVEGCYRTEAGIRSGVEEYDRAEVGARSGFEAIEGTFIYFGWRGLRPL